MAEDYKCGKDAGNSYYMGVETVDKGQKKTFTDAQKQSMGKLISVLADIFDWKDLELAHLNHKTYAGPRKVDTKYTDEQIHDWVLKYGGSAWDGKVPDIAGIYAAEADPSLKNPAAWRLASRLKDLGHYKGADPVKEKSGIPRRQSQTSTRTRTWKTRPSTVHAPTRRFSTFRKGRSNETLDGFEVAEPRDSGDCPNSPRAGCGCSRNQGRIWAGAWHC